MNLTELKYTVAVAQERHFGHAAEKCGVSQPSLSVAIRKLETELGIKIFERKSVEVTPTPIGLIVVERAKKVLEAAEAVKECAAGGRDPLKGPVRLGAIFTIAPYLVPGLVAAVKKTAPAMPLILSENLTVNLLDELRTGTIDAAVLALPVDQPGLMIQPLYDEDFVAAVPADHQLAQKDVITREDIKRESMLILGAGHCFRDQVLDFCADGVRSDPNGKKRIEGSSLQTILYMVAQGLGVTILPASSAPYYRGNAMVRIIPFEKPNIPKRRVVLAWRKSYPRPAAMDALKKGVEAIFYPCMSYNFDEKTSDNNYNCPVVAYYPEVLAGNCDCLKNTKFIYDYVGIHRPHDFTKKMTAVMEREFGPIPHGEIKAAVEAAYGEYERHMKQIREKGAEIMAAARKEGRRIIVLAGRPYHVDPEVNHGIDTLITQFGAAVITVCDGCSFMNAIYETISALCTVGLTTGITPTLCTASKLILIVFMFFGRVGIMTIGVGFMMGDRAKERVQYAQTKVMIG